MPPFEGQRNSFYDSSSTGSTRSTTSSSLRKRDDVSFSSSTSFNSSSSAAFITGGEEIHSFVAGTRHYLPSLPKGVDLTGGSVLQLVREEVSHA